MKIKEIKLRMQKYIDFHGGDLLNRDDIEKAKTKKELADIIEKHFCFLEDQLSDAKTHLEEFSRMLGLNNA